ncbi:hypothetical protein D3C72_1841390 [compost metagenome]
MISFRRACHSGLRTSSLKVFSSTVSMIGAAVEAPGEAPSRAAMLPSAELTTSVPNCRTPPFSASFLITCTRWPAVSSSQSASFASGKYSRSSCMRSSWLSISWPTR